MNIQDRFFRLGLASLFTGGKDSTYATHLVQKRSGKVKHLLTMLSENPDSWMFHTANIDIAGMVAEAVGIPQTIFKTSGNRDEELEDLRKAISSLGVEGIVSGAISSSYQKKRIDSICSSLNIEHITPLWGMEGEKLLGEMIASDMVIMITAVAARGLDESWLGRFIDATALKELRELNLKYGVDICGDGGEMETIVLDAPWFSSRIEVRKARRLWERDSGRYIIIDAELKPKKTIPNR
ncbi:diphthine--ammonia ligase [Candidatus Bathyarchaeota archaeon]|nr:diphthine--ammonia ligase [Candidatus Bathyarchaeota archaeon]MBS7630167.1 diphthine--ammonia ligase [Candidatus Bathyarchaeota archaeon]